MKTRFRDFCPRLAAALVFAASIGPARADYQSTVLAHNPLGYWRFDETAASPPLNKVTNSGTLGSNGDGYAVGNVLKGQAGIAGNSIRFIDPSNTVSVTYLAGKVDVPFNAALNPGPPFSIEFWAKANTLGALAPGLLANDPGYCPVSNFDPNLFPNNRSGWLFYVSYQGRWTFRLGNTAGTVGDIFANSGNAAPGVWQHIAATYDGTNANLYANGALIGSVAVPAANWMSNTVSFLRLGGTPLNGNGASAPYISASSNNGNRGYDGWVDELAIYAKLLSPATIAAHFAAATTNNAGYHAQILADAPVGYWPMEEPAATPPAPGTLPAAVNLSTLGSAANGTNQWGTLAVQSGAGYAGFGAGNKAVFFDGENGYFQVNDAPGLQISGVITMMAWVKPSEKDFFRSIITHGFGSSLGETFLRISRGGGTSGYGTGYYYEVGVTDGTNYYDSTYFPIPPGDIGNWVFLAGTFDGSTWSLYRNGALVGTVGASQSDTGAFAVTNRWTIGSRGDPPVGQSMFFCGSIDEPAIFGTALSATDINDLYNAAQVPPVITQAPQVTNTIYSGTSLSLSVWAEGSPTLNYRWLSNSIPTGVTTTNITLSNLAPGTKTIAVIVTNVYGAITSSVTFDVITSRPIIKQEPLPATRFLGYPFSFSVAAEGSMPLTFYWKLGSTVVQAGPSPTYSSIASLLNAGNYSCLISNSIGTTNSALALLTVNPLPAGYSDAVLASAPVDYWRLDEPSGTAAHDSVGGNDGIYNSTTLGLPGYFPSDPDKAAGFNGLNSYVGSISGTTINFWGYTNFSLEAWVNAPGSQSHEATIIAKGNGPNGVNRTEQFGLDVVEGVYRFFTSGDSTVYAAEATIGPNGTWQHIVGVYDANNSLGGGFIMYIYVNGVLQGTGPTRPFGLVTTTTPVSIGSKRSGVSPNYDDTFNGTIDEVAIFNTALDPATVQAHYNAAFGTTNAPTVTAQPSPATNYAGLSATFHVNAIGSQPLSYQWQKDSADIDGATSSTLMIANLAYTNAGSYSVRISNPVNSTNSSAASLVVLTPPVTPPAIPALVLHLTFDGNLTDATGRGNNGTGIHTTTVTSNTTAPTFVSDGRLGQALHYATTAENTGGNTSIATDAQYVTLGVRPDLQFGSTINFTVAYWIRLPQDSFGGDLPFFTDAAGSTGNNGFVFAPAYGFGTADPQPDPSPEHYGGWAESIYGGGAGFRRYGDLASISDGNWHHLVHVFDRAAGTTVTYLDGVVANSVKTTGSTLKDAGNIDTGLPAIIGQDPSGRYGETGSGDIDDLGVWKKALTPLEAASIYVAAVSNHLSFVNASVVLAIQPAGSNQLKLTWTSGILQSADTVPGPYTDVAGAASPYFVTAGATTRKFYRVRF